MTTSLPFFSALRAFFFNRARGADTVLAQAKDPDGLVKLSRMFVIVAHRAGSAKGIQMMATEVGEKKIGFRSSSRILDGEMLRVEMLLQGFGTFKTTAKVEWVLTSKNSFTGQIILWTTPEQRKALIEFTARMREKSR